MTNQQNHIGRKSILQTALKKLAKYFIGLGVLFFCAMTVQAQPTFLAASSGFATGGTTVTVSHTVGSSANRIMLVGVSTRNRFINVPAVGDITDNCAYNSIPMVYHGTEQSDNDAITYIFYLVDPPTGTANVVVTFNGNLGGNNAGIVGVVTYANVDPLDPVGTYASSAGNSISPSLSVTSAINQVVFDVISVNNQNITAAGGGQTSRWNINSGGNVRGAGSTKAGSASSTTMTWAIAGSTRWSMSGVAIKAISASDLEVEKSVNISAPYAGQTIAFTVTATNNGPDVANSIFVNDLLPSGYTYTSHTASTGTYSGGTGIWNIGTLNNGASATLTINAVVKSSGIYLNSATIDGNVDDGFTSNNAASATVTICQAGGTVPLFNN